MYEVVGGNARKILGFLSLVIYASPRHRVGRWTNYITSLGNRQNTDAITEMSAMTLVFKGEGGWGLGSDSCVNLVVCREVGASAHSDSRVTDSDPASDSE